MPFDSIGKSIIIIGLVVVLVGVLLLLGARIPGIGRLPGDIVWERDNVNIYIPIVTSIVLSLMLTLLLNLFGGFFGRR